MNGIHDMGGMHGFGRVVREENEPVFHEPWEGRVLGMMREVASKARKPRPPGAMRDVIERIEPLRYLSMSYYERFLEVVQRQALDEGMVTEQEIQARIAALEAGVVEPTMSSPLPESAARVRARLQTQLHPASEGAPARFDVGDTVVVRNLNWEGHNRLPRYIRGKRGVVERVNGWYAIEDAHADVLGPEPQSVYTVGFVGVEVWGPECEANLRVYLELWECYLEPAARL